MIDWDKVFEQGNRKPGASKEEIARFVAEVGRPLTAAEVAAVNRYQSNPWPESDPHHAEWRPFDPSVWRMPDRPIPESYISFVRWSNGGDFTNGKRYFQMYGTGLRRMMLDRNIPQHMPGALPFAFNGGGVMYLFDMRESAVDGEYPILCASAGCLTFDPHYSPRVAGSFPEACRGRFNVERLRYGEIVLTAEQWPTCADPKPMLDECEDDECEDDRKLRLFAVACCRRVWHLIPRGRFRRGVEVAERYADDEATAAERTAAKEACEAAQKKRRPGAGAAATNALSSDAGTAAGNTAWAAAAAEAGANEGSAWEAARAQQADLIREIFGNPFRRVKVKPAWLAWNEGAVPRIAQAIYDNRNFADLPVLADALEEAGCTDAAILDHLRAPGDHVRGCWALDLLTDRQP
jgi:hypothetical protein